MVAGVAAERPCQTCGDRVVGWRDFDRRANALAADLLGSGLGHQAKVVAYLYNCVEYLEVYVAAMKAGMVPVNTNYRYGPEEIVYLFDNADAEAVVFSASLGPLLAGVRQRLAKVKRWYVVDDGSESPSWAVPYESVVANGADRAAGPWGRSGDDLLLLYTGGTTGMPKGVMWRQEDLFMVLGGGGNPVLGEKPAADMAELRGRVEMLAAGPQTKVLLGCPLMHGTGQFTALIGMNGGGCIVTMPDRSLNPPRIWQTVQEQQANALIIVGDAFARPLLDELDAHPGTYDLASLALITSSGVMWSHDVKQGLARHLPQVIMFDSLGSSEAVGLGASTSGAGSVTETGKFVISNRVRVLTEDGRAVEPGSDEVGMVAISGYVPLGYYKDEEKTARTFREVDGVRYSIPGDFATVDAEGTIHLLGRGSVCINTGGEKVFPEEVEEVLKEHPAIRDVVCVGIPDKRFGEVVCAVVEPTDGAVVDAADVISHVRSRLAHYKAPRAVMTVESIGRSPAGKVDYRALRQLAEERAGASGT
jgi:fatty-acyl-CoA synthase